MPDNKDPYIQLLDQLDTWYHEHTRHHLVDVDPQVFENLIKPVVASFKAQQPVVTDNKDGYTWIDDVLALIKYSIEYADTHGGCPPAVKSVHRGGVAEAKAALIAHIKFQQEAEGVRAARREANPNTSGIQMPLQKNHVNNTDYDKGFNDCWNQYWTARWKRVGRLTEQLAELNASHGEEPSSWEKVVEDLERVRNDEERKVQRALDE